MRSILFTFLFVLSYFLSLAKDTPIPYTLEDRDRMIRLEESINSRFAAIDTKFDALNARFDAINARFGAVDEKFDAMQKQTDVRFDALQKQMDFISNLMITLIASLIGSIFYMWWDRRRANEPLKEAIEKEAKKNEKLITALKEYADKNPELKSNFDRAAIL